jgi:hypothetical protein
MTGSSQHGWTQAFAEKKASSFAQTFAPDVRLEAATLIAPIAGAELVQQVMEAASNLYEDLAFTYQTTSGNRTYLEWKAHAFGGVELAGVTVLTKDDDGLIVHVSIHHRPLNAALLFSCRLGDQLAGVVDRDRHFYSPPDSGSPA